MQFGFLIVSVAQKNSDKLATNFYYKQFSSTKRQY